LTIKCQPMLNQSIEGLKYYDVSVFKIVWLFFFWYYSVLNLLPKILFNVLSSNEVNESCFIMFSV
jgi:hypothetical protein